MADDRDELARALRAALLTVEETRGDVLKLAARLFAVLEVVKEELPARPDRDDAIAEREAAFLDDFRASDLRTSGRLQLGDAEDKYQLTSDDGPPCAELLPICKARCCTFEFALSTQDLDEGVIRWDHGQPYLIRREADGYCSHFDHGRPGCNAYDHRPAPCRKFDCRDDPRVWTDYAQRLLAPPDVGDPAAWSSAFNLRDRVRRREVALGFESMAVRARPVTDPADS